MSAKTSVDATDAKGAFVRKEATFRSVVSAEPGAEFPPEAGRYILYVAYACPWACRCLALRKLKGLEDAIRVVVVDPVWKRTRPDDENDQHSGWTIGEGVDPIFGARTVRDVYDKSTPEGGPQASVFSVPIFFDTKRNVIVSNESSEIIRFLNTAFDAIATKPTFDAYPVALRGAIDAMNDRVYNSVNNGVYRCGFAKSQEAYDVAVSELFERLDELEVLLAKQRWLVAGSELPTEADIRLFVTIVRFDEVYVVYFKCNKKAIREYPALQAWLRSMYQFADGALQDTVVMPAIKEHYYRSHPVLNTYGVIPAGPNTLADLVKPHGRDALPITATA
jgi:glutathionyl-hydroquinone reductase